MIFKFDALQIWSPNFTKSQSQIYRLALFNALLLLLYPTRVKNKFYSWINFQMICTFYKITQKNSNNKSFTGDECSQLENGHKVHQNEVGQLSNRMDR